VTTFPTTGTERWDGRDRRVTYTYERRSQARSVEVDPDRVLLLDVNYTNHARRASGRPKWSLALRGCRFHAHAFLV
jgi:hypothetical protein